MTIEDEGAGIPLDAADTVIRRRWAHDLGSSPTRDTDAILDRLGLGAVADVRADSLPTDPARLCELGRALAVRPRLLLLDEPASGLTTARPRPWPSCSARSPPTGTRCCSSSTTSAS